ncbi:MAG: DUF3326 domain-containing protein [Candidatus Paceibacterota bacterium]|jgi:hypothetical protein
MITRVYNKQVLIPVADVPIKIMGKYVAKHLADILQPNEHILRHSINFVKDGVATVEMAIAEANRPLSIEIHPEYEHPKGSKKVVVHIVPTGVRASIGGYIADASPATNLLASVADFCITNPNAVNAAVATFMLPNVVYTEGHTLDNLFQGRVVVRPAKKLNQIGLILDHGENYENVRRWCLLTADWCRFAGGINISNYVITDEHVMSRSFQNESGAITGEIGKPLTLIKAMDQLLKNRAHEIDAIVVGTQIAIPEGALDLYHAGKTPDPHGGLEAVISHLLSWRSGKMVAHGPLLYEEEVGDLFGRKLIDARAAGEVIGAPGYLGCVMQGLSHSPRIHFLNVNARENLSPDWIGLADVAAIVAPWNSLGGLPMLKAAEKGIPIIAVKDNDTLLNVSKETLGFGDSVIEVENYFEAVALVKRIVEGGTYRLSDKERSKLLSEGYEIAEATGMALESLGRPVVPFETFAKS